jgi:hypothetical protein
VQTSEVLDLVDDHHPRVEAAFFGHVAEAATGIRGHRDAVPPHDTGVEPDQLENGAHGRGLSRAVRTEEAEDLSGRHREGQTVESHHVPEAPGERVELEHRLLTTTPIHRTQPRGPATAGTDPDEVVASRRDVRSPAGPTHVA